MAKEKNAAEPQGAKDFRIGHRERLRRQFREKGAQSLSDRDLLELLLTGIIQRKDVRQIANLLEDKFKTYPAIFDASLEDLQSVDGMGETSAVIFKAIHEICERYLRQHLPNDQKSFDTPQKFAEYARMKIGYRDTESLLVFYLNSHLRKLDDEIISFGGSSAVSVGLREIAKKALRANADSVVLCHNHPSGVLRPSADDDRATAVIFNALQAVDVSLVDHLIVSQSSYYSYREHKDDPGRPAHILTEFTRGGKS